MRRSRPATGEPTYYNPAEIEGYVNNATTGVGTLQARLNAAIRRAEDAERSLGESQPETGSIGRSLLLASELADKTVSDADTRAAEIVEAAKADAAAIICCR